MNDIDKINSEFYNSQVDSFDKIPFDPILKELLLQYAKGQNVLEIGSHAGALAEWLKMQGFEVLCVEPAEGPANKAKAKNLNVIRTTIQQFKTDQLFDVCLAISSLIHVPKQELASQIEKIFQFLKPGGLFIVSFIEGDEEGFEDPTTSGRLRFFSRWSLNALEKMLLPHFQILELKTIDNKKMDRTFFLFVCKK